MKTTLFEDSILNNLDSFTEEDDNSGKLPLISPAPGFKVRSLSINDYDTGFLDLLKQLTHVGDVSQEKFRETFSKMSSMPDTYYVTVIEDENTGQVIGAGTLLVEQKFIHECALRGRIEDIVVSQDYRGKKLGKVIVRTLTLLARKLKCYKLTLDCRDEMRPFYQSLGYNKEETNSNFMQLRFRN